MAKPPAKTPKKTKGGRKLSKKSAAPWKPGQSGNPRGRPQGSRNKATVLAQQMLDGEVETLVRRCVELALAGDPVALKLCLERLLAPRKDSPIKLALPSIETPADLIKALSTVLAAVGRGELTPMEAQPVGRLLEALTKAVEAQDLDERLEQLEQRLQLGPLLAIAP